MSAGLPGLGLGGLFFIFSAVLAPVPELWRTVRGRSSRAAWRAIARQLLQAVAMIVAIDLALRLTYLALDAGGLGAPSAADKAVVLPLDLIGITAVLLVVVLCGAKLAELAIRLRGRELPRFPEALPRVAPLRAVTVASVAATAWLALLATGTSEFSPLRRPNPERTVVRENSLPERTRVASDGERGGLSVPRTSGSAIGRVDGSPGAGSGSPQPDAGGNRGSVAEVPTSPPVDVAPPSVEAVRGAPSHPQAAGSPPATASPAQHVSQPPESPPASQGAEHASHPTGPPETPGAPETSGAPLETPEPEPQGGTPAEPSGKAGK